METNTTSRIHNLIILDRSGSMYSIRQEAVNHLNECLQTIKCAQKENEGQKHSVTIVTFNHKPQYLFLNSDPEFVNEITISDYIPEGMTALYDAVGSSVQALRKVVQPGDCVLDYHRRLRKRFARILARKCEEAHRGHFG